MDFYTAPSSQLRTAANDPTYYERPIARFNPLFFYVLYKTQIAIRVRPIGKVERIENNFCFNHSLK